MSGPAQPSTGQLLQVFRQEPHSDDEKAEPSDNAREKLDHAAVTLPTRKATVSRASQGLRARSGSSARDAAPKPYPMTPVSGSDRGGGRAAAM